MCVSCISNHSLTKTGYFSYMQQNEKAYKTNLSEPEDCLKLHRREAELGFTDETGSNKNLQHETQVVESFIKANISWGNSQSQEQYVIIKYK